MSLAEYYQIEWHGEPGCHIVHHTGNNPLGGKGWWPTSRPAAADTCAIPLTRAKAHWLRSRTGERMHRPRFL